MTAHEIHALSGAYAMDALDDLERARFEEHLAACAECRAEVSSFQETANLLGDLAPVAPPSALRAQILSEIKNVRPLPPVVARMDQHRPRRWKALVAAAAVFGAVAGGATVWQQTGDDAPSTKSLQADARVERVLKAADVRHASAALPHGASATVFASPSENAAVLVTRKMPAAPAGHVYQLWFSKDGRMVPAGVMRHSGNQTVLLDGGVNDASAVGVTIEPTGGSTEPTTAPVALVDLKQAT